MENAVLYATLACPFAHRAMLALALRPCTDIVVNATVPTNNALGQIDRLGLTDGDPLQLYSTETPAPTAEMLRKRKAVYVSEVTESGETPALQLRCGTVVVESEIVSEHIDSVSTAPGPRLVPVDDPVLTSKVRVSVKRFASLPTHMIKFLMNQEPANDAKMVAAVDKALNEFTKTLEGSAGGDDHIRNSKQDGDTPPAKRSKTNALPARFCHGETPTLADIVAGPMLWRMGVVLQHYRGYDLASRHPRLSQVLQALMQLPQWVALLNEFGMTDDRLITFYAQYANANRWGEDSSGKAILVGRGKDE